MIPLAKIKSRKDIKFHKLIRSEVKLNTTKYWSKIWLECHKIFVWLFVIVYVFCNYLKIMTKEEKMWMCSWISEKNEIIWKSFCFVACVSHPPPLLAYFFRVCCILFSSFLLAVSFFFFLVCFFLFWSSPLVCWFCSIYSVGIMPCVIVDDVMEWCACLGKIGDVGGLCR